LVTDLKTEVNERYRDIGNLQPQCEFHRDEMIRFYCKDCFVALCSECVLDHAKHDFIGATNLAASEVKMTHFATNGLVNEKVAVYQNILDRSEKRLVEMGNEASAELIKLKDAFTEIREFVDRREA